MNHLIFKIETAQSPQQRLTLLKELELYLESDASVKHKRFFGSTKQVMQALRAGRFLHSQE